MKTVISAFMNKFKIKVYLLNNNLYICTRSVETSKEIYLKKPIC